MRIWIAASHDAVHRNGGWAFVRMGTEAVGMAGGERRTTRARATLTGFVAALKGTAAGETLAVVASRPDALVLHTLLKSPEEPPTEDLDLRASLAKALDGRTWTLAIGDPDAPTPFNFAVAWADMASEKAKMSGTFSAAIPKSNLSKARGI